MSEKPRRDARAETEWEALKARELAEEKPALVEFFNTRYRDEYAQLLEGIPEFGRHGVMAEFINRLLSGGLVLDLGCGTGILADLIDLSRFEYHGVDLSNEAIQLAQERSKPGVHFERERIEDFRYEGKASAIVLNEVLYYLDKTATLAKCEQLLEPGGLLLVSIFDFPRGLDLLNWLNQHLSVLGQYELENRPADLKWHILCGQVKRSSD